MVTAQRLNVSGEFIYSLRYSLVPLNILKSRVLTIPIKHNTLNCKKNQKNYFNKNLLKLKIYYVLRTHQKVVKPKLI